jgi:hypothetical protein
LKCVCPISSLCSLQPTGPSLLASPPRSTSTNDSPSLYVYFYNTDVFFCYVHISLQVLDEIINIYA